MTSSEKFPCEAPAMIRYNVRSLDMWGHVSSDCSPEYDCRCIKPCEPCESLDNACSECEGSGYVHDENACECSETCNQEFAAGFIEVRESDSDDLIVQTLIDDGYLKADAFERIEIRDYGDGDMLDVTDREGRRLYSLERADVPSSGVFGDEG